jgi:hypothetical protein
LQVRLKAVKDSLALAPQEGRRVPQATDEYDAYIAPIARKIAEGRSEAEFADYLLRIETETLGLDEDAERAWRVAAILRSLT